MTDAVKQDGSHSRTSQNQPLAPLEVLKSAFELDIVEHLKVDIGPLNNSIGKIVNEVRKFDALYSKIYDLEIGQQKLKRDINTLSLNVSSQKMSFLLQENPFARKQVMNPPEVGSYEKGEETVDHEERIESIYSSVEDTTQNRLRAIDTTRDETRRNEEYVDYSLFRSTRNEVINLKAIINQIQHEHDNSLTQAFQNDERIESLHENIAIFQEKINATAKLSDLNELRKLQNGSISQIQQEFKELGYSLKRDLNETIRDKLINIKGWFKELENTIRSRQSMLTSRATSFAKECDLKSLKQNFYCDMEDVNRHLKELRTQFFAHDESIKSMKKMSAIAIFVRSHRQWKQNIFRHVWVRWKSFVTETLKIESATKLKEKYVRKILLQHFSGYRSYYWRYWKNHIILERQKESQISLLFKSFCKMREHSKAHGVLQAFNSWRLKIAILRINIAYSKSNVQATESPINTFSYIRTNMEKYDLEKMVTPMLKNDISGAIQTLVQDITHLRHYDVSGIRHEMLIGKEQVIDEMNRQSEKTKMYIDLKFSEFEKCIDKKFKLFEEQLPSMKTQIYELRNNCCGIERRVKTIEQSHIERINFVVEEQESFDNKLSYIEELLQSSIAQIDRLKGINSESSTMISTLQTKMACQIKEQIDHQLKTEETLSKVITDIGALNLLSDKHSSIHNSLNDDIIKTRNEIIQSKVSVKEDMEAYIKNSLGVTEPPLSSMIQGCLAYERMAMIKNYIVAINSVTDEKGHEVDVTGHMSIFAHGYARWIAYQSNCEALMRVIAGRNPDNIVYADEDIASRRKVLLNK